MRIKKLLFAITALFVASCSKEPFEFDKPSSSLIGEKLASNAGPLANGVGTYYDLGRGYDVTGHYANEASVAAPIIDVERFEQDHPGRYLPANVYSTSYFEESGESAEVYSKSVSNKIDATANYKLFGLGISTSFNHSTTTTNAFDIQYVYGAYNMMVKTKRLRMNADAGILRNYLKAEFVQDLDNLSPENLVRAYGTHVMIDIYVGGKLEIKHQSKTTNTNRTEAARVGIKAGVKAVFDVSVDGSNSIDVVAASKNFSKSLFYATTGGDPTKELRGLINLDMSVTQLNIAPWQNSITDENSKLIDFSQTGLIPIYELVADPSKRNSLTTYINQYMRDREVKSIYFKQPVYSLYYTWPGNPTNDNHLLSMFPSEEWGEAVTNEGIAFYAYQYQKPGTVPVHRYRSDGAQENFFTTSLTTIPGYRHEGVAFYAYPNSNSTSEYELKPIYRYWSALHADHYYTDYYGYIKNYAFERIEFYVPK